MGKVIRLYDRSRTTTDWNCPRKRYWQYEFRGKGIVWSNTHLELFLGTTLHDGLAAIARGVEIEAIATTARDEVIKSLLAETTGEIEEIDFAHEQAALVEGLLRGFFKHVWSKFKETYEVVLTEQEMAYPHDGLIFMSKPDLVVRDKEGCLHYIEYKSTSSKKEGWVNSWATAVQLHSTIKAIEEHLGEGVTSVIVQGLYKGYESYGKQSSPFCYAYKRSGNPPFSQDLIEYSYKAGFKRYPTWDLFGGTKQWVEEMPEVVLGDQFPQAPPIFIKEDLIGRFFAQRAAREHEIAMALQMMNLIEDEGAKEAILNTAFEQHFDQCYPYFGKSCQYLRLCHGEVSDPLSEGYTWRVPHHQPEVDQWEDQVEGSDITIGG